MMTGLACKRLYNNFRKDIRMIFFGFQKMTLLDYPGKVACTLFTGGCNLRCPFCHNALLVTETEQVAEEARISDQEVLTFLERRRKLLDGVCITGGEPLLHHDLPDVMRRIKALGYPIKLDTNGTFPDRLEALLQEGLVDYVAMDIKNAPEKYAMTVGVPDFDMAAIEQSVALLKQGRVPYEFRTTVLAGFHTVEDIATIAQWIQGVPHYFLQNFKDSGQLICPGLSPLTREELVAMRNTACAHGVVTDIRGV